MPTPSEPLMQPEFEEEWAVVVDKEVFALNKKEADLLKKATIAGQRGLVWFPKFAISIPHISAIYLTRRTYKNQLASGKQGLPELTDKDLLKNRERIKEIKEKLSRI